MKTDIWMPIFIKDYLGDTSRLRANEHGVYLLLLFDYWINGALPNDMEVLKQVSKEDNLQVISRILDRYFILDEATNAYRNNRLESEKEKALKNREAMRENGKKGGRPKNLQVNLQDNQQGKPNKTSSPSPTQVIVNTEEREEERKVMALPKMTKSLQKPVVFIPPTIHEVQAYINANGLSISPWDFYKHYEAATPPWTDKDGKPLRNWKQKLLTWDRFEKKKNVGKVPVDSMTGRYQ